MKRFSRSIRVSLILTLLLALAACGSNEPTSPPAEDALEVSPPQPLSTDSTSATFELNNTSARALSWSISVENAATNPQTGAWFDVAPEAGELAPGAKSTITLTLKGGLEAGTYASTLNVTYPGGQTPFEVSGTVGTPVAGSFRLSTDPDYSQSPPLTLVPNGGGSLSVIITPENGFAGEVALELLGAPEGVTGAFAPPSLRSGRSTLTLQTSAEVASGDYELTVKGTSGSVSSGTPVLIRVINGANPTTFNLASSPSNVQLQAGKTARVALSLERSGGFDGAVELSASGVPSGVSVSFSPNPIRDEAVASIRVGNEVAPGSYTLTLEGKSGAKTTRTRVGLSVGDAGRARLEGTARTEAYLGDFRVPDQLTGGTVVPQTARPAYVEGEVLVLYDEVSSLSLLRSGEADSAVSAHRALARSVAAQYDLTLLDAGAAESAARLGVPRGSSVEAVAADLMRDPRVRYAGPNHYIYPLSAPDDELYDQQWNMASSGLSVAWDVRKDASNITVAVIDSGFDTSHSDLRGRLVRGYDFCASAKCATRDSDVSPDNRNDTHGTHVAGIIGAVGNERGVAGALQGGAKIVPVKTFYNYRDATEKALADAIRWAAGASVSGVPSNANPANIINLSLGTTENSPVILEAVRAATARGALLVAAAGNGGVPGLLYPAAYPEVVAVGSVNSRFERSCFSNTGAELDFVAAGGDGFGPESCRTRTKEAVLSTIPFGNYGTLAGTSQASPLVAGIAALVWSERPVQTAAQVLATLEKSAYKTSAMSTSEYGKGVLRADLALGLPGPGARVSVSADGPGSALDTVTLNVNGETEPFTLTDLEAGGYDLEASASGAKRDLSVSERVTLSASEVKRVTLQLEP